MTYARVTGRARVPDSARGRRLGRGARRGRVELLVFDTAALELRGRVAAEGVLLFDDDPPARVRRVATIYFGERPRPERAHRESAESVLRRARASGEPSRPSAR